MRLAVMNDRLRKVPADKLRPGLYVERLDRPWTETPFLFQGFYIQDQDDIEELKHYCRHVFVDTARDGREPERTAPAVRRREAGATVDVATTRPRTNPNLWAPRAAGRPAAAQPQVYADTQPVEEELAAAGEAHETAGRAVQSIYAQLRRDGRLDLGLAERAVAPMMESVLRNADAMVLLSRMKRHDAYIYQHSVGAAVLGLAFARHLGLDRRAIQEIGLGCLLFDVGKTQIPGDLLHKSGPLTDAERRIAMAHVEYSVDILQRADGITERVLDLVRCHHERFDGSGYPAGLRGNEIPTFAKIAGIVDCYDALISERPYAKRRTPYDAVREVYTWRGTLFQPEVVERFMQVVGAFPVGSLVELNTGAVGVVVAQNEVRRLRPRLMLILDADKRRLPQFDTVDLLMDEAWSDAGKVWIEKPLPAGAHGIDPDELYL